MSIAQRDRKTVASINAPAKVATVTAAGEQIKPVSASGRKDRANARTFYLQPMHRAILRAREKELNLGLSKIVQLLIEQEGQTPSLRRWMRRRLRVKLATTQKV